MANSTLTKSASKCRCRSRWVADDSAQITGSPIGLLLQRNDIEPHQNLALGISPVFCPALEGEGFAIPEVGGGAERSNARGQMRGTGQLRALHALYLTVFPRSPYLAPQGLLSQGFFLSGRTIVG
jgi:hypothetical protein